MSNAQGYSNGLYCLRVSRRGMVTGLSDEI
jgi:hypothetical protein